MASENICRALVRLLAIARPRMNRKVEFTSCFHHSMTEAAFELLTNLTHKREAVQIACRFGTTTLLPDQLVAVDAYLSDLWILINSLNGQPQVRLDRPLRFDWSTYMYTNKKEMNASSAGMSFELMMTMHLKANLHYHLARSLVEADYRDVAEASKHLAQAAGLLSYLEVSLSAGTADWAERPCEMKGQHCAFMRKFYHTCAQQMFAARAIQSGNALAAKVALAVSTMMAESMVLVPSTGYEALFEHVGIMRDFYHGVSYKLRAEALAAKTETGQAMGCCNFALIGLTKQTGKLYNPFHRGLPKIIAEPLSSGVTELVGQVRAVHAAAARDNNLIYFHPVPTSESELAEPFHGMSCLTY
jgi:hypothetical protein